MMAHLIDSASDWIALALVIGVIAAALGAATARSLFAMVLCLAAAGALASTALLAFGVGDAALGQALFGVGIAPFVLLAVLLLSTRAAKPRTDGRPWLTIAAAGLAAAAVLWAVPQLGAPAPARVALSPSAPIAPWLAPLIALAACVAVGLIGFGERGAIDHPERD